MIEGSEGIDEIERRLTRALERVPEVAIPEDFAQRVAARVPMRRLASLREMPVPATNVGWRVAGVAAVVLLVAMFVLARVGGRGVEGWLEIGLAIEFAVLTAWMGLRMVLGLR